jgi:hypothetical protein
MGWIYAVNPFVGVFVYKVVKPAGKPPKGRAFMDVTDVEPCSSTGCKIGYRVREVFATKAEATKAMAAALAQEREWRKQDDKKKAAGAAARKAEGYAKRVHFYTQRHVWKEENAFVAAREKGLALCETYEAGSKIRTADKTKVTCQNCIRLMRPN